MNALELTQRQRKLLENIAKAIQQYQQATADASARLEHEFEQIKQSCDKERQRIEEERKEKVKLEDKPELQQEIAARRSAITPPRGITTIEAVKGEINRTLSTRYRGGFIYGCLPWIILVLDILIGVIVACSVPGDPVKWPGGFLFFGLLVADLFLGLRSIDKQKSFSVNKIALLHHLYDRWLELVDERASAQRAEAQRRYEQAVAQAKGQMLAAAEQWRPAIAEFGALTEPVSPLWGSEAWRRWEPGRLGPGAVRLGVFKMEV